MGRKQTKETREKISNALRGRLVGNAASKKGKRIVPLITRACANPNCTAEFQCERWRANKYCSLKCACYKNGGLRHNTGKKGQWYFNRHQNKEVYLDSTWEVEFATWLDTQNIAWERPSYFIWVDATGKPRKYYPDFYIVSSNKYFDIKNDFLIQRDKEKINCVRSQNTINLEVLSRKMLDDIFAGVAQW